LRRPTSLIGRKTQIAAANEINGWIHGIHSLMRIVRSSQDESGVVSCRADDDS
jgi:hypothetical protein